MSLKDFGWECPKCHAIYAPHVRSCESCSQKAGGQVEDLKPEQIITPLPAFDEPSDDEILYWATPYYDQLMAEKALRNEQLKLGEDLNGNH